MTYKKRMFLFFAIYVLFCMTASFHHPVSPTIYRNIGAGDYMFGVALGSMMSMNFLFSPFWGKLNDYISSRRSLLICCFGYGLGMCGFGLAQTGWHIVAARLFAGIFTGGVFVSVFTYIANKARNDQERGSFVAIYATIGSIGGAFGYMVGGIIGEFHTYIPIIMMIITLPLCGVMFYLVCENDAQIPMGDIKISQIAKETNPFSAFWESRKFINLLFVLIFTMSILTNYGIVSFDQTFNYYIKDQFNFTSGYNGVFKGIMGLIALAVNSTITIRLIKKTDIRKSLAAVLLLNSFITLCAVMTKNVTVFILINIVFFAAAAMNAPILQNIVAARVAGPYKNLIIGVYNSMWTFGGILGAFGSGAAYTISPKLPFICGVLAFILATVITVLYYKKSNKEINDK